MRDLDRPSGVSIDVMTTARLMLRPLTTDDVGLLFELNGDEEVMRFITGRPGTVDEATVEVADSLGCRWLAFERDTDVFIGWFGAIPSAVAGEYEIGWRLRRSAWGRGLATEGARALIDALFDRGANRVYAETMAVNERSRRVMERCGLRYCRTFHLEFDDPLPGTELGEIEYALSRPEWSAGQR
jgi:RimJ/RimL family protein N-acetyltransferase